MNTTQTMSVSQSNSSKSSCRCHEQPPAAGTCCSLVCFDRPNYFCGHLLTDADLSLQQKYVMEKNKLYHRALDGHGVVCGLKLTCDCQCKGHILIHDGFAIDDCGNDLVVCETARFDVITALKDKNLLVTEPPQDDCEPKHRKPRCEIKQCFYVTICYDEQVSDYETPFQSSCTSGPKECLPTRTHERVRFDVTDKLPPRHSYLTDLEKRFKECFEINCDSPVGSIMKRHLKQLQYIVGAEHGPRPEGEEWCDPCELFCTLRAYFLNHLKVKPDEFNCGLFDEVSCLTCPREGWDEYEEERREHHEGRYREHRGEEEYERREEEEYRKHYREELREAFCKLLACMQRYQFDCVFGELIFSCEQPCEAHCLVLGTVEIVDGNLVRVCNTPRDYRWTPANLVQVLLYNVMTGRFASGDTDDKAHCCPDYGNCDPTTFLNEFELSECGRYYAAKSVIDAFKAVSRSLHRSFDFTDCAAISPITLERAPLDSVKKHGKKLGINVSVAEGVTANSLSFGSPIQDLLAKVLLRPDDSLVAYKTAEGTTIGRVLPDYVAEISPDRTVGEKIKQATKQAKEAMKKVKALEAAVIELTKRLDRPGSLDMADTAKKSSKKSGLPTPEE